MLKILFLVLTGILAGCTTIQPGTDGDWIGSREPGKALFYTNKFQNRKTASGVLYDHNSQI
jgi:rare lipoprotein A